MSETEREKAVKLLKPVVEETLPTTLETIMADKKLPPDRRAAYIGQINSALTLLRTTLVQLEAE